MSAPSLQAYMQGQGQVNADGLNTFVSSCDTISDLQSFIGMVGIQVYLRGLSAVNDGGQGMFFWNANGSSNDGINNIAPFGASLGCWTRLVNSANSVIPSTASGPNAIIVIPDSDTTPITSYQNHQLFSFVAAANSTGSVTASVAPSYLSAPLPALPIYLPNGVQAASGDIVSNVLYIISYVSSLNSGSGGFQIINASVTSSGSFVNINVSGTATIANLVATNAVSLPNGSTAPTQSVGNSSTDLATTGFVANFASQLTDSLTNTVSLSNTSAYFDGPMVAQGTSGVWFASGTVTLIDSSGGATMNVKLWDGTTLISSTNGQTKSANIAISMSLSGWISNPAGNLRISVNDATSTSGLIANNNSGLGKDSTLIAFRIGS